MVNADSEVYSEVNGCSCDCAGPQCCKAQGTCQDMKEGACVFLFFSGTSRLLEVLVSCSEDARFK